MFFNSHLTFFVFRVFPSQLSAKDARQSLKRTEVPKNEPMNENEAEAVLKQKGDSLRRVPADENPILKEMDDRADVKVRNFQFCFLHSIACLLCRII